MNSRAKACANLDAPILSILWAAGLSFSRCHAEQLVPNDVNLKGIFVGEEFSRGIRLWTHGYDFYSVSRPYLGTYYGGEKGGRGGGWRTTNLQHSHERLKILSQVPGFDTPEKMESLGFYKLGNKRSLSQYIEFSGIDPRGMPDKSKFICAPVYVPWYKEPDPKPKETFLRAADTSSLDRDNKVWMKFMTSTGFILLLGICMLRCVVMWKNKPRRD